MAHRRRVPYGDYDYQQRHWVYSVCNQRYESTQSLSNYLGLDHRMYSLFLGESATRATLTPPYDRKARWMFDFDRYSDYPGSPVM